MNTTSYMKSHIAVIGAGFTGLAAAYELLKQGHSVTIFEKDPNPGGLAIGYQEKGWKWSLEKHYHHWFTNDNSVLSLAEEIHHNVIIKRPKTSSYIDNEIVQLDSPLTLLQFPKLSLIDRLRTAFSLGALRYNPFWKMLEGYHAIPYLKATMGETAYKTIWEPLMVNKLGKYADEVSLAWFWARIKKRTTSLAYPEGGYLQFADHLVDVIKSKGGEIHFKSEIIALDSGKLPTVTVLNDHGKEKSMQFGSIIVTLPSFLFIKLANKLPTSYKTRLQKLKGIGAVNMVLRLNKTFLKDGTYWLNMCSVKSPILAIVEHTNFMDSSNYGNEHLVYVGNYVPQSDRLFSLNPDQILDLYNDTLTSINPLYKNSLIDFKVFKAPFAQPIIPVHYSKMIPSFDTPLRNIFLANIEQVYPWDRGTNYAVELGRKVVQHIAGNSS